MPLLANLELDVVKSDNIQKVIEFTKKNACPAIVVSPDMVSTYIINRGIGQAKFKIIAAVDWPRGEQYGIEKMRGMTVDALSADGFEIILTAKYNYGEIKSEVKYLSKFFSDYFNKFNELRFVLDIDQNNRARQAIAYMLTACKEIPLPRLVRTIHLNKLPPTQATAKNFNKHIEYIKSLVNVPIKISGGVTYKLYSTVPADRFAASLSQAEQIAVEMHKAAQAPRVESTAVAGS